MYAYFVYMQTLSSLLRIPRFNAT